MNERIKELAEQAEFRRFVMPKSNSLSSLDNCNGAFTEQEAIEKFAELIVKECAEFVSNDRQNDDYGVFVANRIKEHFGVEE